MNQTLAGDGDIEVTRAQNRNFLLAQGFHHLSRQSNSWSLLLRYQAQAERLYRRAVEEFDRLKALRDELPNEPVPDPEPEQNTDPYVQSESNPFGPPPPAAPQPPPQPPSAPLAGLLVLASPPPAPPPASEPPAAHQPQAPPRPSSPPRPQPVPTPSSVSPRGVGRTGMAGVFPAARASASRSRCRARVNGHWMCYSYARGIIPLETPICSISYTGRDGHRGLRG
jgi:hypothetical protein